MKLIEITLRMRKYLQEPKTNQKPELKANN